MFYDLIYINNHEITSIICMLSVPKPQKQLKHTDKDFLDPKIRKTESWRVLHSLGYSIYHFFKAFHGDKFLVEI